MNDDSSNHNSSTYMHNCGIAEVYIAMKAVTEKIRFFLQSAAARDVRNTGSSALEYHYLSLNTSHQLDVWFQTGGHSKSNTDRENDLFDQNGRPLPVNNTACQLQQSCQNEKYTFELPPGMSLAVGKSKDAAQYESQFGEARVDIDVHENFAQQQSKNSEQEVRFRWPLLQLSCSGVDSVLFSDGHVVVARLNNACLLVNDALCEYCIETFHSLRTCM